MFFEEEMLPFCKVRRGHTTKSAVVSFPMHLLGSSISVSIKCGTIMRPRHILLSADILGYCLDISHARQHIHTRIVNSR